ncbi:MAG: CopG family transcriptional regulator [Sphingomonadales bacterium]|nr:CopG family transcriptional regulator [Sphingomonadales bacterium]MDE2170771.1 CopG family transcriptional regulator [Sphingomonadales bacterium]
MSRLTIRLDDALDTRLRRRARGANLSLAVFCRNILAQATDRNSRYIYSSQDEILATTIQTLSIVATSVGQQSPKALEKGLEEARAILAERGLLAGESGQ